MTLVRIESVETPLDAPGVFLLAARLLTRMEAMGLLPADEPIRILDRGVLERALRVLAGLNIGQSAALEALTPTELQPERLRSTLQRMSDSLAESPLPSFEWRSLPAVLGEDLLVGLLGVSASSLRRYRSGSRPTPDDIAARLHFLALLVADLAGAYNEIGIRNWFRRVRSQLDGMTPVALLSYDWTPDDEAAQRIRLLAESLIASPAT